MLSVVCWNNQVINRTCDMQSIKSIYQFIYISIYHNLQSMNMWVIPVFKNKHCYFLKTAFHIHVMCRRIYWLSLTVARWKFQYKWYTILTCSCDLECMPYSKYFSRLIILSLHILFLFLVCFSALLSERFLNSDLTQNGKWYYSDF